MIDTHRKENRENDKCIRATSDKRLSKEEREIGTANLRNANSICYEASKLDLTTDSGERNREPYIDSNDTSVRKM